MIPGDVLIHRVAESDAGSRLDLFIGTLLAERSRSFAARLIAAGQVRVNGENKKPSHRLRPGDSVSVYLPPPEPAAYSPEPIPLEILFEDPHIVVINKPPGLVVHPAPGHAGGTLVNALLYHCPDLQGIGGERRPGIVHRLDKDTSGTLVAAKNALSLERLARQFKSRTVRKDYLALVHGEMPAESGVVMLPIGRHPLDRKRMSTTSRKPREAETRWRVLRRFREVSLLELGLKTGRTHQIRVHCAAIRHPIVGDPVYGRRHGAAAPSSGDSRKPDFQALLSAAKRQMLHAWRLGFEHPQTGEWLDFESRLPEDMKEMIDRLKGEG
jgi:23S rRNA pseudouridine1911/1915/1917 synthase